MAALAVISRKKKEVPPYQGLVSRRRPVGKGWLPPEKIKDHYFEKFLLVWFETYCVC